jgi:zinc protease
VSRLESRLKLALPLAAAVAATILFAPQCSRDDKTHPADTLRKRDPDWPPEMDPDKWATAFSRQHPPPEELTEDAALTRGTFDNGFRYALLEHPGETGRISLRLLVMAGSLHEEESESGLAHFVEHMAFQGGTTLPDHSMEVFERLGLKAGADTNAWTARDCTVYKLDIPDADEKALETAFTFLRDVADGILFAPAEVDSERRIVLREMEEAEARNEGADAIAATILPGLRAAQRAPIGLRSVIEKTTAEQLRSFWQRHYVPSRMTLVATGDFKTKELITRITRHFSPLPPREAPAEPPTGDPMNGEGVAVDCLPCRAGQDKVALRIAVPQPEDTDPDSAAKKRTSLGVVLSLHMMSRRLSATARATGMNAVDLDCGCVPLTPRFRWLEASETTGRTSFPAVLEHLAREWRRARDTGFTDAEFAAAKSDARKSMRTRFSHRLSRSVVSSADLLLQTVRYGTVFESAEDELNRSRILLSSLTRAECEELGREWWSRKVMHVLISGDLTQELADEATKAVRKVWAKPPSPPPVPEKIRALSIESFGPPGRIKRKRLDRERSFLEVEFENHVLARLKPLPGLGGSVSVSVHAGFGPLAIPPKNPGLGAAADLLTEWYPLPGWNLPELKAALGEAEVSVETCLCAAPVCSFNWTGETDRYWLKTQLELLCAGISRPGFAALKRPWTGSTGLELWSAKDLLHGLRGEREFIRLTTGDDVRFNPQPGAFLRTNSEQLKEWLVPILNQQRLCVIIAGDFAPAEALPELARTFGALPARDVWSDENPYPPLSVPGPGCFERKARSTQAQAWLLVPGIPANTPEETWHQTLLTEITGLRLKAVIREALGQSYSPRAGWWNSAGMDGWLGCNAPCSDGQSAKAGESLRDVLASLRKDGWTEDEYNRAARPLAATLRANARTPEWWLDALLHPEASPVPGQGDVSTMKAMEPEVKRLMQEWFDPAVIRELHVEPAGGTAHR